MNEEKTPTDTSSQDNENTERHRPTTIKEFREVIDRCMNSVKYIRSTREVSLTFTSLQRAFMWIGESQKFTGSQSPYIHSQDPASTVIEPTADHVAENDFRERWNPLGTHTARVKDFRLILSFLITDFRRFIENSESAGHEYNDCIKQSFLAMKEAKGWLGWELGRIKKEIESASHPQAATAPTMSLPL